MAVTFEYGRCAQCNEEQSKTLQQCRSCNAPLPWTKAAQQQSKPSGGGIGLGDVAWGAMAVQIVGGLIFVAGIFFFLGNIIGFFPTFPGVGYITMLIGGAIWRGGAQMN